MMMMMTGGRRRWNNDGSWCRGAMALIRASCGWSTMKLSWMRRSWDKQSAPLCVKGRYRASANGRASRMFSCTSWLFPSFHVSPAFFSHENHVGTKHSAWFVPIQLVAIERSADSSHTEKEREREREREREGERERERAIEKKEKLWPL